MTSTIKTATLSLLLAAAANAGPLEARASGVQGFDISGYQSDVDFASAYGAGARFVMIKVSNIRSLPMNSPLLTFSLTRPLREPATLINPSPATTKGHPQPVSSEAVTTLRNPPLAPEPARPSTFWPTVAAGPMMARPCRECWTWSTIHPARPATASAHPRWPPGSKTLARPTTARLGAIP